MQPLHNDRYCIRCPLNKGCNTKHAYFRAKYPTRKDKRHRPVV